MSTLVVTDTTARHETFAMVTEAPSTALAVTAARRQGVQVEILDQRTENRTVWAQPNGSLSAELTAAPIRAREDGADATTATSIDTAGLHGWTTVYEGPEYIRESTHWNGSNTEPEAKPWLSGQITARVGRPWGGPQPYNVARSFFQFDTSFLAGHQLNNAVFLTVGVFGPSCGIFSRHELFATDGRISPSTNWNNQPAGRFVSSTIVESSWDSCQSPKYVSTDATAGVNTIGLSTFFLKAADEFDMRAFRKFRPEQTALRVVYEPRSSATGVDAHL